MKEVLKKIRLKNMCDDLGLDYRRIRNYSSGAVKSLTSKELRLIAEYIKEMIKEVDTDGIDR